MGNASSEDNAEPSFDGDGTEAPPASETDAGDDPVLEVARTALARLIDVEVMLRDFWCDSTDHTPMVAARINVAARFVHQAAKALAPQTLL
jgi:hypothetical protein